MLPPCKADSWRSAACSKCVSRLLVCLLLSFWQCTPVAGETPAGSPPSEIYIDELIDPASAETDFDAVYREYMEQPPGLRYLRAELLHYREDRDNAGESIENAAQLLYRRETLEYGELEVEAALLDVNSAAGRTTDPDTGMLLTLRQRDYAINF